MISLHIRYNFPNLFETVLKNLMPKSCRTDKVENETIIKMIYTYINIQNGWATYD